VIAQLVAIKVAAHPPGLDPSVEPKFTDMIHGYFPAVDCSPPTIRVVPSWPHLQVGAVVVVVTVVVVAPAAVVVVAPDAVVVVVAPAAAVVAVVAGAAVVVVQHGLVGKVGVKSMPNLAS